MEVQPPPDIGRFAIGFDPRDRAEVRELWDEVFESQQWTEGAMTRRFEALWGERHGTDAVATGSWTGAALAALDFAGVGRGDVVLCPSNTFMATPLVATHLGARVEFVDCERDDLCLSLADLERQVAAHRPKAVIVVHIGGHLAFRIEEIAELCRAEGVFLLEDCAHAHGASFRGRALIPLGVMKPSPSGSATAITGSRNRPTLGITPASRSACALDSSRWYGVGLILSSGSAASTTQNPPNGSRYTATTLPPTSSIRARSGWSVAGGASPVTSPAARPTEPASGLFLRFLVGAGLASLEAVLARGDMASL